MQVLLRNSDKLNFNTKKLSNHKSNEILKLLALKEKRLH